jgi:hypothetical protein
LDQLDGWDKHITPQPKKSFAIGTFLRESGDSSDERSMIAFVDPEPEPSENPVELPGDAVRRANFGAWLSFMGFDAAGDRLRMRGGEPERRQVPVVTLGGQKFVVRIISVTPLYPDLSSRKFWDEFKEWPLFLFDMPRGGVHLEVVGLDLKVFEALRFRTDQGRTAGLMKLKPGLQRDEPTEVKGGAFYGSVLSDGSLLGELRFSGTGRPFPNFEWIEVEL